MDLSSNPPSPTRVINFDGNLTGIESPPRIVSSLDNPDVRGPFEEVASPVASQSAVGSLFQEAEAVSSAMTGSEPQPPSAEQGTGSTQSSGEASSDQGLEVAFSLGRLLQSRGVAGRRDQPRLTLSTAHQGAEHFNQGLQTPPTRPNSPTGDTSVTVTTAGTGSVDSDQS